MATPAEVLKKTKSTDKDNDKDDKNSKGVKRNALLDFIAKSKKSAK